MKSKTTTDVQNTVKIKSQGTNSFVNSTMNEEFLTNGPNNLQIPKKTTVKEKEDDEEEDEKEEGEEGEEEDEEEAEENIPKDMSR
jgi:hypothetical protein